MPEFVFELPSSSAPAAQAVAETPTTSIDQAQAMLDRLPEQFKRKRNATTDDNNNITKLLKALAVPLQTLEDTMREVIFQLDLNNATEANLDVKGKIVGEPRNGFDDDTYRRRISARIVVHRSNGTIDELIKIVKLVINDDAALIQVLPQVVATVIVRVLNVSVSDDLADDVLFDFLQKSIVAGVRIVMESGSSDPAGFFRFDVGPGLDVGHFADRRG